MTYINSIWASRVKDWNISERDKVYLLQFIDESLENVYGIARIRASLSNIQVALKRLEKPLFEITLGDIENLVRRFQSGEIRKDDGEVYNEATPREINKVLRLYHEWKSEKTQMIERGCVEGEAT